MSDATDLDSLIDAGTALLGIPLRPEWRDQVRLHLRISFDLAQQMLAFPLPDEIDPAPVFEA